MTTPSISRTEARGQSLGSSRNVAVVASAVVMALEAVDAFLIEQPLGAIIAIAVFAVGSTWLLLRGGRGPAVFLGVFFALEILGNFTIFGVTDELLLRESRGEFVSGLGYTVATIAGLVSCVALIRRPAPGPSSAR